MNINKNPKIEKEISMEFVGEYSASTLAIGDGQTLNANDNRRNENQTSNHHFHDHFKTLKTTNRSQATIVYDNNLLSLTLKILSMKIIEHFRYNLSSILLSLSSSKSFKSSPLFILLFSSIIVNVVQCQNNVTMTSSSSINQKQLFSTRIQRTLEMNANNANNNNNNNNNDIDAILNSNNDYSTSPSTTARPNSLSTTSRPMINDHQNGHGQTTNNMTSVSIVTLAPMEPGPGIASVETSTPSFTITTKTLSLRSNATGIKKSKNKQNNRKTTRSTPMPSTTTTTKSSANIQQNSRKSQQNNRRKSHHRHRQQQHPPAVPTASEDPSNKINDVQIQYDLYKTHPTKTCVIGDVCGGDRRTGLGGGYCYRPHEPKTFQMDDEDEESFYELLFESCPHFFDENEELRHPVCCTAEMEETMSKLIMSVDLIRRSCPSCLTNVKKLFCNLFCAPNQRDFVRVDRVKGEQVLEVTYAMSEMYVEKFFQSCQDVRVFGAYLMDFESACGQLKRANCTAIDFLNRLGALQELPFQFRPLIISKSLEEKIIELDIDRWPRHIMNDTAYKCDEAPPNQSACRCEHCPKMCLLSDYNPHKGIYPNQQQNDLDNPQETATNFRINVRHVGPKKIRGHNHSTSKMPFILLSLILPFILIIIQLTA